MKRAFSFFGERQKERKKKKKEERSIWCNTAFSLARFAGIKRPKSIITCVATYHSSAHFHW